jgi:hypothetical protein
MQASVLTNFLQLFLDGAEAGPLEATMAWCSFDTVFDTGVSSGTLHANAAWTAPRGKAPPQSMSQAETHSFWARKHPKLLPRAAQSSVL